MEQVGRNQESPNMIKNVELHDATLVSLHFGWHDGTCIIEIRHGTLGNCHMTFKAVSHLTLPRAQNWGRSVSINAACERSKGRYEIEMQSGDLITIKADDVTFAYSADNAGWPESMP